MQIQAQIKKLVQCFAHIANLCELDAIWAQLLAEVKAVIKILHGIIQEHHFSHGREF